MSNDTNAANNGIPNTDADAKELFDDYTSTQSPPSGHYPLGTDGNNGSIFMPVTDNTDATDIQTGPISPKSNPPMPRPGSRLIDQSGNRNYGNF